MIQQFISLQSQKKQKEANRVKTLHDKIHDKLNKTQVQLIPPLIKPINMNSFHINVQPTIKPINNNLIKMPLNSTSVNQVSFQYTYDPGYENTEPPLFKTIFFVYTYTYNNNERVTGLGDFIRGCYFLLQFCDTYNLNYHISIIHPLQKYLSFPTTNMNTTNMNTTNINTNHNMYYFTETNANYDKTNNVISYEYVNIDSSLIPYLNGIYKQNHEVCVYFTNHPNCSKITKEHIHKIKTWFSPNEHIKSFVNTMMDEMKLVSRQFKVVHVRLLDTVFENDELDFSIENMHVLTNTISNLLINHQQHVLLISNSNAMKKLLVSMFPTLKTIIGINGHVCNEKQMSDDVLIHILSDFYIMSHSSLIYSFSMYEHGSGFSKWCALTYDIPYISYYIGK